jgi:hypothetical protein
MFVDSHSIAFSEVKDDTFNINKEIKELERNKKTVDIVEVFTYLDADFVVMECTLENFSKKKIVYRASLGLSQGIPVHCIKEKAKRGQEGKKGSG